MTVESNVERKILQCIDDGLQTLGDEGKKAIYYHLKKNFGLRKGEIPKKPEIFRKGLNSIFGEEGTYIIERWILEKLKMGFDLKQRSKITFTEAITTIKAGQEKNLGSLVDQKSKVTR